MSLQIAQTVFFCVLHFLVARLICKLLFEVAEYLILENGEKKKSKTKQKKQETNKKHLRFNCPRQKAEEAVVNGQSAEARVKPLIGEDGSCAAIYR